MPTPPTEYRYPCENCGSSPQFAPGQNALVCSYCGHRQTISPGAARAPGRQAGGGVPGDDVLLAEDGVVVDLVDGQASIVGVTEMLTLTAQVHAAGARVVWDYAGGAPYLPIDLSLGMEAVVASPHKFVGGPGASGVLIVRRDAVRADRPSSPGGGTVRFVSPHGHDYAAGVEAREEAGTPNVIGDIRAALAFAVKDAVGQAAIDAAHARWWAMARAGWWSTTVPGRSGMP